MKKIEILTSGAPAWLRSLIVQEGGRFWTGQKWSRNRRRARLYANQDVVQAFREIEEQLFADKPLRTFEVPLRIRMRADQDIDITLLSDYLLAAVQIFIDQNRCGTGPIPGSLVQLAVTWAEMHEVPVVNDRKEP